MYHREITPIIHKLASLYPVIGITGPRQSGKTTLARALFPHLPYVSLEDLDTRLQATEDPRGFLAGYQEGAIFDEVQHTPTLLSYLQGIVDSGEQPGRFILTGSQHFALSEKINQTLAGRIGMVTLLPFSLYELEKAKTAAEDPYTAIFNGGYPRLFQANMQPLDFYPSYIQTYVERDVRQIKNIENLARFQTFLKLCAGRIGQLINFSSLAQDAHISHTTAKEWLTILEASYLVFTLTPFHQNFNKRLTKMSKLYFYDTGLASVLLGLENAEQLKTHYLKGALFENLMVLEILKGRMNQGLPPHIYFWRDHTGHEVDLIGEWGGKIKAMEIKLGSTFQESYIKNLQYFSTLAKNEQKELTENYLIYTGNIKSTFKDIKVVPMLKTHEEIF